MQVRSRGDWEGPLMLITCDRLWYVLARNVGESRPMLLKHITSMLQKACRLSTFDLIL